MSLYGDSFLCEPVDLQQEHECVKQVKAAITRCVTAEHSAQARARMVSYLRIQAVLGVALSRGLGRQSPMTATQLQRESEEKAAMCTAAQHVVKNVYAAGRWPIGRHVAGHPNVPLRHPDRLCVLPQLAENHMNVFTLVAGQGLGEGMSSKQSSWAAAVPENMAMPPTAVAAVVSDARACAEQRLRNLLEEMVVAGFMRLPDSNEVLESGEVGADKAALPMLFLTRYAEHELQPFLVFKDDASLVACPALCDTHCEPRPWVLIVDGLEAMQGALDLNGRPAKPPFSSR